MWLDRIPASVAFCDVETTGLSKDDRIVSFGGIGMISDELAKGRFHLAYSYLVFDPGERTIAARSRFMDFRSGSWPFRTHSKSMPRK
jgi:DNA polymerase III epsilon subunit-like protein